MHSFFLTSEYPEFLILWWKLYPKFVELKHFENLLGIETLAFSGQDLVEILEREKQLSL